MPSRKNKQRPINVESAWERRNLIHVGEMIRTHTNPEIDQESISIHEIVN